MSRRMLINDNSVPMIRTFVRNLLMEYNDLDNNMPKYIAHAQIISSHLHKAFKNRLLDTTTHSKCCQLINKILLDVCI